MNKALHKKLMIEQHEAHCKSGCSKVPRKGRAVPASHVGLLVLLLLQTSLNGLSDYMTLRTACEWFVTNHFERMM
jgi:hypothetical protein